MGRREEQICGNEGQDARQIGFQLFQKKKEELGLAQLFSSLQWQ